VPHLHSPDGEENYPGNLDVTVTYLLSENGLAIHYEADCDADTVLNMTNHAYFNLKGYDGGDILDQTLQIDADYFTAVDKRLIPVENRAVAGTPFDFTAPKAIGAQIREQDEQLLLGAGYDHNFLLNGKCKETLMGRELTRAAILCGGGLTLTCYTDKPCLQIYTGNFMENDVPFKGGVAAKKWSAVCLETQYAPDSPNHGESFLKKGEHYDFITAFTVGK
jgi:aldose 1-epimerase